MTKKAAKKKSTGKKAVVKKSARRPASTRRDTRTLSSSELEHSLDALLHTMRCITQHEDELCTLLHDARKHTRPSTALVRELRTILLELPGEEYVDDLYAVQQMIAAP